MVDPLEIVTLIITTSPTPTNPSTELLSAVLESFSRHCPDLLACKVILVIDTYDQITPRAQLKKGHVTAEGAASFHLYKEKVKSLILTHFQREPREQPTTQKEDVAEFGSPDDPANIVKLIITQTEDEHVTFIEPTSRLGFGLAVRSALRIVETPYIWVHQHDWTLATDIPLGPLLDLMTPLIDKDRAAAVAVDSDDTIVNHGSMSDTNTTPERSASSGVQVGIPVKYICLPSIRLLSYATSDYVHKNPALRLLTRSLKGEFTPSSHPDLKIPLTPLFFWYDKPHMACKDHYLARIFPSSLAMRRGTFIEDTVGHRARTQMKEGQWHKWACWLYYPDNGKQICLRHLNGRKWRGAEAELEYKEYYKAGLHLKQVSEAKSDVAQ